MKGPLRVRLWKSVLPAQLAQLAESVNVSQRGIYFSTDSALCKGETVVSFNMPEVVLAEPSSDWRCAGHVEPIGDDGREAGRWSAVFDCYEVSRSKPADSVTGMALPREKSRGWDLE
jgi:hypothetical protein